MTAIVTSLERRLAKIEASRRPPRGLYFVAWGCTPAEIEEAMSRARRTGHIADGEPIVRCAWPVEYPVPESRWVRNQMREFDRIEFGALMGEVDRFQDELCAALHAEIERQDGIATAPPMADDAEPRDEKARTMTDAALIGVALAVPLNGERASLTEDRMQRLVQSITTLGTRDRIRGRDDALFEATQRAGRITTH